MAYQKKMTQDFLSTHAGARSLWGLRTLLGGPRTLLRGTRSHVPVRNNDQGLYWEDPGTYGDLIERMQVLEICEYAIERNQATEVKNLWEPY